MPNTTNTNDNSLPDELWNIIYTELDSTINNQRLIQKIKYIYNYLSRYENIDIHTLLSRSNILNNIPINILNLIVNYINESRSHINELESEEDISEDDISEEDKTYSSEYTSDIDSIVHEKSSSEYCINDNIISL
jgi:hypothetical protein